jgi:hypothetical protein
MSEKRLANNKKILTFELVGAIFIIFLGSALHFTYTLSGNQPFIGFFSAVNEAVWEHLKLAFWSSLFWMLIELIPLRKDVSNFFAAKAIGTYAMVIFIPVVFYSYTAFTGKSIFPVDITTFVVAVIVGQVVSYKLFQNSKLPKSADKIAIIAVIILAIAFIVFTFSPPHFPIFQDPNTKQYGIYW